MKKFITIENGAKEGKIMLTHYMPFDAVDGLGKTEEELLKEGVLVDEVPEPELITGKIATPYYTEKDGYHYIYEDAPQTQGQNMTLVQSVQAGVITPEQFEQITGMPYTA